MVGKERRKGSNVGSVKNGTRRKERKSSGSEIEIISYATNRARMHACSWYIPFNGEKQKTIEKMLPHKGTYHRNENLIKTFQEET